MKKLLLWLADFLERKFPDVVTVRKSDYDALQARMKKFEEDLTSTRAALGMMVGRNPFER